MTEHDVTWVSVPFGEIGPGHLGRFIRIAPPEDSGHDCGRVEGVLVSYAGSWLKPDEPHHYALTILAAGGAQVGVICGSTEFRVEVSLDFAHEVRGRRG